MREKRPPRRMSGIRRTRAAAAVRGTRGRMTGIGEFEAGGTRRTKRRKRKRKRRRGTP